MNALELADELELRSKYAEDHGTIVRRTSKAVAMLRQLQDERDKLFLAHSHEMARADIAEMEVYKYKQILERIANERCGGKDEDSSRHRN
jgi:hypothetical protein